MCEAVLSCSSLTEVLHMVDTARSKAAIVTAQEAQAAAHLEAPRVDVADEVVLCRGQAASQLAMRMAYPLAAP